MEDSSYHDPHQMDSSFQTASESEVSASSPESDQSQAASESNRVRKNDRPPVAEDIAISGHKKRGRKHRNRASVLAEGQHNRDKKVEPESGRVSCELSLSPSGCTAAVIGLAEASSDQSSIAMERASSYTSDEWEEQSALSSDSDSNLSDRDNLRAHVDPDSSDDDDPRSQVDRLIEKGTLMYMDGENSCLSSEDESDDDTDSSDYDSESDITDVSPLISAATSPIGLSPVLPRRTVPTSPLALHDNRDLYMHHHNPFNWDIPHRQEPSSESICDNHQVTDDQANDSTNMKLLLQAVIELENHNRRSKKTKTNRNGYPKITNNEPLYIHPIRDNPHHTHLNKTNNKRKNMSFSNEEVHKIDRENRILLKKLISAHTRHHNVPPHHRYHKPSNSSVNRKRDEQKIKKENLLILRKIQEAKPSKDVQMDRSETSLSQNSLRSQTSSCGASIRSISQPSVRTPRKETAL